MKKIKLKGKGLIETDQSEDGGQGTSNSSNGGN